MMLCSDNEIDSWTEVEERNMTECLDHLFSVAVSRRSFLEKISAIGVGLAAGALTLSGLAAEGRRDDAARKNALFWFAENSTTQPKGYGLVGRYDPVRNQIGQMIGTGQIRSHSLAVSKDGEHIFVANGYSDNVSSIGSWDVPASQRVPGLAHLGTDLIPGWFASTIPVGHKPEGIALSPDAKDAA
jgi:hypothetical protein